jgi:predicted AAA+ superfamily ATPase
MKEFARLEYDGQAEKPQQPQQTPQQPQQTQPSPTNSQPHTQKQHLYLNFEARKDLHAIFEGSLDPDRILQALSIYSGLDLRQNLHSQTTLLLFDEIQECPRALTALKYFQEQAPHIPIIAAGSLLGVSMHSEHSFPVGKVEYFRLHPLNFPEFLDAMGQSALRELLQNPADPLIPTFRDRLIQHLRTYLVTGGMPEVVADYQKYQDINRVREIQNRINLSYEQDFSKHAPPREIPRIRMVWQSIVSQLAKENSKYMYGLLRQGARAKDFELALTWLQDAGLIHKLHRISKPGIPLSSYADWSDFKVFLHDVGLLGAMAGLSPEILLKGNQLFEEFKGILTEQYVIQQLKSLDIPAFYWSRTGSNAEIDVVIQRDHEVIPIEVKAAENLRAKSLRVYHELYQPETCIRTSLSGYREQEWMVNVPLYALPGWLDNS